ncbi:unnamed protein product [Closterium sp. Yama58-4]|nr:unnamed protein product [Closterium sp. Yama58-4]
MRSLTQRTALRSTLDGAYEDAQDTVVATVSQKVNTRIALETSNGGTTTTVHRTTGSTSTTSSGSRVSKVPVMTSVVMTSVVMTSVVMTSVVMTSVMMPLVVMNMARLSFGMQRCISIDPWVKRRSRVVVSWNVYAGNIGTDGVDDGLQCSRVLFFEATGCQGEAVDSISNPSPSAIL